MRGLPDVEAAEGSVNGQAQLIGKNGKAIVYGGAPNLGFSIANGASRFNPLKLVEGSWPQRGDVVIDESTAKKEHFKIGQSVGVQAEGPARRLRISGFVRFGSVSTIGGATLSGFDLPTAQELFDKRGRLDEIAVAAKPGVADEQLVSERPGSVAADRPGQDRRRNRPKTTRPRRTASSRSCAASCSPSAGSPSSSAAS